MAKVTTKLQVTLPKALAERYEIEPGDDIVWEAAGDVIRIVPPGKPRVGRDVAARVRVFDKATARQAARGQAPAVDPGAQRGWSREDLYDRDRAR